MLQVENLGYRRHRKMLFEQLGFSLQPGEALRLEGPNGSGKTTLLRLLCGLNQPTQGTIFWQGIPLNKNRAAFFSETLYIGHQTGLKEDLTPVENLRFSQSLNYHLSRYAPMEALDLLGLHGCENRPCRYLSAGQKRRVALARLFVIQAKVWLLDEPFTALDKKTRHELEEHLSHHLSQEEGMAILTTHHPIKIHPQSVKTITLGAHTVMETINDD